MDGFFSEKEKKGREGNGRERERRGKKEKSRKVERGEWPFQTGWSGVQGRYLRQYLGCFHVRLRKQEGKGPNTRAGLVHLTNSKQASVAGAR